MSRRCPSCGSQFEDETFFCGFDGTITIEEQDPNDTDPRLGTQLGQYVVVARVADGAMGRVYEGRHPQTKARVAIKVLHAHVARDNVAVERLKREYETAQSIDHPHVVDMLELGQTGDGSWFVTMEYLEGEELGALIRRGGALPPARMLRILCQAALALDHAHSFGLIHRDLKPDNVFVCRSGQGGVVKLLDFGSVKLQMEMGPKLTALGTTIGSPYYMSPEQAMGKQDVDRRTDVFALAAILYEMATGVVAFEAGTIAEVLMKLVNEDPAPPTTISAALPVALDDVVEKGLRKDKTRRYDSPSALAKAAAEALGLEGSVERWASAPLDEVVQQVAGATPPAPKPYGASVPPPTAGEPDVGVPSQAPEQVVGLSRGAKPPALLWAGIAVLGLVTVGGVIVAAAVFGLL